jgi:hypothetical protein
MQTDAGGRDRAAGPAPGTGEEILRSAPQDRARAGSRGASLRKTRLTLCVGGGALAECRLLGHTARPVCLPEGPSGTRPRQMPAAPKDLLRLRSTSAMQTDAGGRDRAAGPATGTGEEILRSVPQDRARAGSRGASLRKTRLTLCGGGGALAECRLLGHTARPVCLPERPSGTRPCRLPAAPKDLLRLRSTSAMQAEAGRAGLCSGAGAEQGRGDRSVGATGSCTGGIARRIPQEDKANAVRWRRGVGRSAGFWGTQPALFVFLRGPPALDRAGCLRPRRIFSACARPPRCRRMPAGGIVQRGRCPARARRSFGRRHRIVHGRDRAAPPSGRQISAWVGYVAQSSTSPA